MTITSSPTACTTWTPRKMVMATLTVLAVGATFLIAYRFYYALFILLAAMMLRVAIKPAFERLRARGVRPELSVALIFGTLGLAIIGLVLLIAPLIADQIGTIVSKLPQYYVDARATITQSSISLLRQLGAALPLEISTALPTLSSAATLQDSSVDPLTPVKRFVSDMGYGFFLFVASLMMTGYWTLDADRVTRALLMRVSAEKRESWRELIAEMEGKVGSYFRGQLVLCGFIFVLSTASFFAIGLPNALVLGLINGLFEALPMIGPVLGMVPALLIALATSPEKAIWVLLAATLIQQIENNILVPRVMDKSVGINPIISIVAITAFSLLFGLVGAVFAIPLAAMLQILIGYMLFKTSSSTEELPVTPTHTGLSRSKLDVLRMEARELADDVRKQSRTEDTQAETSDHLINSLGDLDELEDLIETMARDLDDLLAQAESAHQPKTVQLAQSTGAMA